MTTPVSACSQSDPGSGVDEVHGDLLPDEKIERICGLSGLADFDWQTGETPIWQTEF